MVFMLISHQKLPRLKKLINDIDPQAFFVVSDTLEVLGRNIGNQPHGQVRQGQPLRGFKFFFADTVFVHQFVQLAAADAGITRRVINLAAVTDQDIFQIIPFDFFNSLLPGLRQCKFLAGGHEYRGGPGFE